MYEVHRKIWHGLGSEGETLEKHRKFVEEKAEMIGQLYEYVFTSSSRTSQLPFETLLRMKLTTWIIIDCLQLYLVIII